MADYRYDPINNNFTVWLPAEEPVVTVHDSIFDTDLDISNFASGITEDGTPVIKPERSVVTILNNPEYEHVPKEESLVIQPIPLSQYDPTRNYTANPALTENLNIAMQFFMSKGLEPYQAAGIVGNLMHESGDSKLNITTNLGDNGSAYGIAQWRLDRRTNLKKYAQSKGTDMSDFLTQLEFVWKEMEENPSWLKHLKMTTSVEGATKSFMDKFERPNVKYANLQARLKHAKSLLR